jgi:hypothetical protein
VDYLVKHPSFEQVRRVRGSKGRSGITHLVGRSVKGAFYTQRFLEHHMKIEEKAPDSEYLAPVTSP